MMNFEIFQEHIKKQKIYNSMYQDDSHYKQKLNQHIQQILTNLNKYIKSHNKIMSNKKYEPEQKQHMYKIMLSLFQKIQLDMLKVYDYLQQKQEQKIAETIGLLVDIIKMNKIQTNNVDHSINYDDHFTGINKLFCYNCKIAIQKSRINLVKNKIGITDAQQNNGFQSIEDKLNNELEDDDGFLQKHNSHIANLQFYISELLSVIEKKVFGKAADFLAKDTEIYLSKNRQLIDQQTNVNIGDRQFAEIQKNRVQFSDRFLHQLRIPIKNSVLQILQNMEKKKKQRQIYKFTSTQVQTIFKNQNEMNAHLEQKISNLQKEISRMRNAKIQSQKNAYKLMQKQSDLKKQLSNSRQQKHIIEQRYRKYQQTSSHIQTKLKYELNLKTQKIEKLQKNLYELRQRKPEIDLSKYSSKSIRSKKLFSKNSITEKQSVRNINGRSSLDMKLTQEQIQNMFLSRFKNGKKYSLGKKSRKVTDSGLKQVKIMEIQQQQKMESRSQITKSLIQSKANIPYKNLTISQQFDMKIINQKSLQANVPPITLEPFNSSKNLLKKVKTLRMLKPHRKQNSRSRSREYFTYEQRVQNISFNNTIQPNFTTNAEQYDRNKIFTKNLYEILRLKTQPSQVTQNKNSTNKQPQKLKPGTVLVRNIKSRQLHKTQNIVKAAVEFIEIKGQNLILFGNDKTAAQYEKNVGLWPHMITVDKLAVDVENTSQCLQIQKYFRHLQQQNPQIYKQYIKFLVNPSTYIQSKKKNQTLQTPQIQTNTIKQIFIKLIRFHKVVHKNCNHVSQFLQAIGFYQN